MLASEPAGTLLATDSAMASIVFYEKPGCAGHARQRAILQAAGHALVRRDLLTEAWTADDLLDFLAGLPVRLWFNRAAPRIKSGDIVPEDLDAESALAALLDDPLLIRRPLMRREDGASMVGFDLAEVQRFVGLGAQQGLLGSLEACAAGAGVSCDP